MQWVGELVVGSQADRNWKLLRRIAGSLNGIKFHLHLGVFYTDPLTEEEIESLIDHPWVRMQALGEGDSVTPDEPTGPLVPAKRGRPRREAPIT